MNNHSSRRPGARADKSGTGGRAARAPAANGREPGSGGRGGREPEAGKRERILDAAVRVFAAEGFYNAKVSQIAHAAGVADGTIYLYFKSKDDLLIQLFEDRMEQVNANLRAALAAETSAPERLQRVVRLHLELIEANRHMAEVITVELRQSSKFIKEYANPKFAEFLRLIASAIADGQRAGELRADLDPPIVARALFGALDEIALAWLAKTGPEKLDGKLEGKGGDKLDKSDKENKKEKLYLRRAADQLGHLFIDGLRAR